MTRIVTMLVLVSGLAAYAAAQLPDEPRVEDQISTFVRRIHEDHRGHLWLGTNGDGVFRHDGVSLTAFDARDGLGGNTVRGIVEDADGDVWFGTERGLARWDGTRFWYHAPHGDAADRGANDVWALAIDSRGLLWVGTLAGVSTFDGETFTPFDLPETVPDETRGVSSPRLVRAITEDGRGRMWFATSGGAFVWDGETLDNVSVADGLCGDGVNDVLAARDGSMWFATHHHGVCRLEDGEFIHHGPAAGVAGVEVWSLFEDRDGNVWFPTEGHGVYRFDGERFTRFGAADGLFSHAVQCVAQDRRGRILAGGYLGLYRLDGSRWVNLTRDLPWP